MKEKHRYLPFRQAIPALLLFGIISFTVLQVWLVVFSFLSKLLLRMVGRVAVTSGDFVFVFTTWQGILLLILSIVTLFVYLAVDINSLIILCSRLLNGEKPRVFGCIRDGFVSLKKLLNPRGLLVLLYLAILSPIAGFGISITLTQNFYIPKFISSVIYKNPIYTVGLFLVMIALIFVGLMFIYILHGALLDGMKLKDSAKQSRMIMKKNWKSFLFAVIRFFLISAAFLGGALLFSLLPRLIVSSTDSESITAVSIISNTLMTLGFLMIAFIVFFIRMFSILLITKLYYRGKSDNTWQYQKRKNRKSPLVITVIAASVILAIGLSVFVEFYGDMLFPSEIKCSIVAHRAGGDEAPENTCAGVDAAYKYGAYGSEIDIQRTKDGYYAVNHDSTFERVAGVDKKPSEMTLKEIKELRVDGEPVPTLEEMLDSCKGRVTLFVELKGDTADEKMADDAVRIIKERDMVDETAVISLKYDLINYVEEKYPEIQTGYLAFASFGDTAELNCDCLMLEEETASTSVINDIHKNNKKVYIWTVNDEEDIENYMLGSADGIITDSVAISANIKKRLSERTLSERLTDGIIDIVIPD